MIVPEISPLTIWSCHLCQEGTSNPYWLDQKPFCNYKHGFNFVWRIIFGWYQHPVRVRDWCKGYGKIEFDVPGYFIEEGLSDETIKIAYSELFNLPLTNRQDMAFQIAKHYMKILSKEVPEYAKN